MAEISPLLLAQLSHDDRGLVWRYAFDASLLRKRGASPDLGVAWRVDIHSDGAEGPCDALEITIDLSHPCEVRLDQLLAHGLGLSRSAVTRMQRDGRLGITPADPRALRRPARAGQRIDLVTR